jgi:2-methylcitrate dehydratase PrpD
VALDLRAQEGWSAADVLAQVDAIEIETYGPGFEIVKEANPRTPYQAKFSLAYCVSAALLEGRLGLPQFAADRFDASGVRHRDIADLLTRVRITVAPELTAAYPAAWPARVVITTRAGRTCRGASDFPRGNAENPVSTADLEQKCADLLESRCGTDVARRGMDALRQLETCTDVADLFRPFGEVATASPLSVTTS